MPGDNQIVLQPAVIGFQVAFGAGLEGIAVFVHAVALAPLVNQPWRDAEVLLDLGDAHAGLCRQVESLPFELIAVSCHRISSC